MTDTTKQSADQSFFVFVKDANTGKIRRIAIPGDVQIGLQGNPAELQLLGRLSVSANDYSVNSVNKGILHADSNDTIISVSIVVAPASGRVTLYLPGNPRNGQLHFIKDTSGTANGIPIDIMPPNGILIDQNVSQSITTNYGSIALYWFGDHWRVLVLGVGEAPAAGPIDATYITLSNDPTLTHERALTVNATNIALQDNGPNSNVNLDITPILGGGAGTFVYATVTADQYGRITSVSPGIIPVAGANVSASYVTIGNTGLLPNERALAVSSNLSLTDGGPNGSVTIDLSTSTLFKLSQIPDVSASYITIGNTGSLPNERSLIAGVGIMFTDGGPGGGLTITNIGGSGGGGADVSASYVTIGNTGSLPNERALAVGTGLSLADGGANANVTIDLSVFNKFQLTQIPDVSASYITIGNTGSLPNERSLVAGSGISFADSGPNGTLVITNISPGGGSGADVSASYVTIGNTGSLPNERALVAGAGISITDGGAGGSVTITNTVATAFNFADVSASYVTIGNTGSLPNERALAVGTGLSLVDGGPNSSITLDLSTFNKFQLTQIPDVSASYIVVGVTGSLPNERSLAAGTNISFTDNGPGGTFVINSTGGGGGSGGADVSASYVIIGNTGSLPNERALTAGAGISIIDNGPNSSVVIAATGGGSGADVSASYVIIGNTGSLPNERALVAGTGITIVDNGAGNSVVINATGGGGGGTIVTGSVIQGQAAYQGFTSASVFWSATGSWTPFTGALAGNYSDVVSTGISRSGSTFQVLNGGLYYFHAGFNAYGNDAYISLRLRNSFTNVVSLQRSTYRSTPIDQNLVVLEGVLSSSIGDIWQLEYVSSGSVFAWTSSNPTPDGTNMRTGEVSMFMLSAPVTSSTAVPIFSTPILAGTVTTNTAFSGNKLSLGMMFFNPQMIQGFGGTIRKYYYRTIVDMLSTEPNMSASVDLYDLNGIVAWPPGIIQNSTISSSNATSLQLQVDLTSALQFVSGSGIFEARLWRTVSGSLTSSVSCRNARIDVEFA